MPVTLIRRSAVFKAFAAAAILLPPATLALHLRPIMEPLFRATNRMDGLAAPAQDGAAAAIASLRAPTSKDRRRKSEPAAAAPVTTGTEQGVAAQRALAQEVLDLLEGTVGAGPFLAAYSYARKRALSLRDSRRAEKAAEKVRNPSLAAQRQLRRNRKKVESKKRKASEGMRRGGKLEKRSKQGPSE